MNNRKVKSETTERDNTSIIKEKKEGEGFFYFLIIYIYIYIYIS